MDVAPDLFVHPPSDDGRSITSLMEGEINYPPLVTEVVKSKSATSDQSGSNSHEIDNTTYTEPKEITLNQNQDNDSKHDADAEDSDYDPEDNIDTEILIAESLRNPPEYDVKDKLKELNAKLAQEEGSSTEQNVENSHQKVGFGDVTEITPPSSTEPLYDNDTLSKLESDSQNSKTEPDTLQFEKLQIDASDTYTKADDSRKSKNNKTNNEKKLQMILPGDDDNTKSKEGHYEEELAELSSNSEDKNAVSDHGSDSTYSKSLHDNDKPQQTVLVEREGTFHLIPLQSLKSENDITLSKETRKKRRVMSAKPQSKKTQRNTNLPQQSQLLKPHKPEGIRNGLNSNYRQRPKSATTSNSDKSHIKRDNSIIDDNWKYHSPYKLTDQERMRLKEEWKKEKEKMNQENLAEKTRENETAFEAWLQKKKSASKSKLKPVTSKLIYDGAESDSTTNNSTFRDGQKEYRYASYDEWASKKKRELKKEKLAERKRKKDTDNTTEEHSPREVRAAYRRWLKSKRVQRRQEEAKIRTLSYHAYASIRKAQKRKASLRIIAALFTADQLKFISQYGYQY